MRFSRLKSKPVLVATAVISIFFVLEEAGWITVQPLKSAEKKPEAAAVSIIPDMPQPKIRLALEGSQQSLWTPEEDKIIVAIRAHHTAGDYETALKLAEKAIEENRFAAAAREWVNRQMPALLASTGWAQLRLGACEGATTNLERALALDPLPDTKKGLGFCYYKLKNYVLAEYYLAEYMKTNIQDCESMLLYTDVLESFQRIEDAAKSLQNFLATKPTCEPNKLLADELNKRLRALLERAKQSGAQLTQHSTHFTLTYHFDLPAIVVTEIFNYLEETHDLFTRDLGFDTFPQPMEVVLYPEESFRKATIGGPEWAEGIFDGRMRIPVKREMTQQSQMLLHRVLRHELTHALLAAKSDYRRMPSWFNEGLAQVMECYSTNCTAFSFGTSPGDFLGSDFLISPYISLNVTQAGRAYRQSLYLMQVLMESCGGYDCLRETVSKISTSSRLDSDSILATTSLKFSDLQRKASAKWAARHQATWIQ